MKLEKFLAEFPISVYGNLEQYNETLSRARCRIFYKGPNRNGSYITDEFAEKLASSLPYTPIKGIYNTFDEDYTDHGNDRDEGRIYGIVPENPNFAWEKHVDEDGVIREYACTDVLLFTAIYKEAGEILNKAQSMEIYEPSIQGEFEVINGRKYFVFTEGCFLGLQILGEDVEPCFEGAAFFQLMNKLQDALDKLDKYNLNSANSDEGGTTMQINYMLSDREKFDCLWNLLNVNYNEEGNWAVDYEICEVYDEYALVRNYAEDCYERVYYEKDTETEKVSISKKRRCCVLDVTEDEKHCLDVLRTLNNNTYELVDEIFQNAVTQNTEYAEKITEFEQQITEKELSISTLLSEKEEMSAENATLASEFTALKEETESLKEYKLAKETEEKMAVIEKYALQLDEEIVNKYKENVSEFTKVSLEKELAFELVQSKPSIFSMQTGEPGMIPHDDAPIGSLESVLEKYRK